MTKKKEENKGMSYGWVCPKCGCVYAIWVDRCSVCGPKYQEWGSGTFQWEIPSPFRYNYYSGTSGTFRWEIPSPSF